MYVGMYDMKVEGKLSRRPEEPSGNGRRQEGTCSMHKNVLR